MTKELLNDAERYLLKNWADARLLEESMEDVRTKYKQLCQQVIDAVGATHPELDANVVYLTQSWTDGQIGFGRKSWPGGETREPAGLWLIGLRIEELSAEDSEPPYAAIWVPKKTGVDLDAARVAVKEAAEKLLTSEERTTTVSERSGETLLWWPTSSKRELLDAVSDGDGQKFVDLLVSDFKMLARFVPVLDRVFSENLKSE
jgi:hypothetical protein